MSPYRLPKGYRRNLRPLSFDDNATVTGHTAGWIWQPKVYPLAFNLAQQVGAVGIVDLGCGSGRRLREAPRHLPTLGVDRLGIIPEVSIDERQTWLAANLDSREGCSLIMPTIVGVFGGDPGRLVFICSDVLEHLIHPEHLVDLMAAYQASGHRLAISTPDRPRTRGENDMGPSANPYHVQEWALDELVAWLTDSGIRVLGATYTASNDHEMRDETCLIIG